MRIAKRNDSNHVDVDNKKLPAGLPPEPFDCWVMLNEVKHLRVDSVKGHVFEKARFFAEFTLSRAEGLRMGLMAKKCCTFNPEKDIAKHLCP